MVRAGILAVGTALLLGLPARAFANAGVPFVVNRTSLGGAVVSEPTALVVESEDLTFRCELETCAFRAIYHVYNPTSTRQHVAGVFYGGVADQSVQVEARGADIRTRLAPEAIQATDATVQRIDPSLGAARNAFRRTGFTLVVEAGERVEVVFKGTMKPYYADLGREPYEFVIPALVVRHPLIMPELRTDAEHRYRYALSPIRSWGGSPVISVTVVLDPHTSWNTSGGGWQLFHEDGATVARRRIAASQASTLEFSYVRPGNDRGPIDGGPLLGVGARLDVRQFRMRAGWEAGWGSLFLGSAVVETDFSSRVTFVPTLEASTPNLMIVVPAIGAGVGLPVQLRSGGSPLVGLRMQGTLSFPALSLVFPVDYFPKGAGDDRWQLALFAQLSL